MPCGRRLNAEMKQKDAFLESEGDAWFRRNVTATTPHPAPQSDSLLREILELPARHCVPGTKVLEIGCGDGARLGWLRENRGFDCYGIDPSPQAVAAVQARGIAACIGTAERLPFEDQAFEIVIFGFCLYLCDREDLFRIASEADRVLRNPGWLLILDFYSPATLKREYHHRRGLFSYKMDYRTLFTWHPAYTSYSHKLRHHSEHGYTDDATEWVATSVLRKHLEAGE
jgi:ubiquinone/menaquinone biosynthesis C-methylase UbiE